MEFSSNRNSPLKHDPIPDSTFKPKFDVVVTNSDNKPKDSSKSSKTKQAKVPSITKKKRTQEPTELDKSLNRSQYNDSLIQSQNTNFDQKHHGLTPTATVGKTTESRQETTEGKYNARYNKMTASLDD